MTNKQILKKAIEKAIKNGYKDEDWIYWAKGNYIDLTFNDILFSHDFAKAFWKDGLYGWEWYLQELVLKKEPLKYLEKFL